MKILEHGSPVTIAVWEVEAQVLLRVTPVGGVEVLLEVMVVNVQKVAGGVLVQLEVLEVVALWAVTDPVVRQVVHLEAIEVEVL